MSDGYCDDIDLGVPPTPLPPGWRLFTIWIDEAGVVNEHVVDLVAIVRVMRTWRDEPMDPDPDPPVPYGWQMAHNDCDGVGNVWLCLASDLECINSAVVQALAPGQERPTKAVLDNAIKSLREKMRRRAK